MSDVMRYGEPESRRIMALAETAEMREQRCRVIDLLAPRRGWRILDVGCGPGHLAGELADVVGTEGRVFGVDVSNNMLALARSRPGVQFDRAQGIQLPYEDEAFDAAVATQAYEFVESLPEALGELQRVLRPGASAVILDTDWDSLVWASADEDRMRRVLYGWRRRVADPHLPRVLAPRLREAGFEVIAQEVQVIFDPDGRAGSYSVLQIDHLGASAIGVAKSEVREWAEELRARARAGDYFFSVNRYLFRAAKPEG
jgi:arsenite methyltransferase